MHVDTMRVIMTQNLSPRTEPRSKLTIFLLLPRPFLLSLSPSPSGTLWTRFRLPRAQLSKMAQSALAARAKYARPAR